MNLWYAVRGSGLVALVLLSASTVLGVIALGRWQSAYWPRFATQHLHRNVSLLAVAFLALHIATTVIDGFAPVGWLDAVIPFASPYRRIWLGLGAIAFDLLLAVIVTSMLRRRMSYGAWRSVHLLAWAAWPIALVHGLGTGTDGRVAWSQLVYIACAAAVLAACWVRLLMGWNAGDRSRVLAAAASIVVPLLVMVWAAKGPLQPGWSQKAGTPAHVITSPPSNGAALEPGP
jgi:sulfoxide reductase heme-binding subunit YedZ